MARKGGLGRGLESLMGGADAEVGVSSSDGKIPLSKIRVNKNQPRRNFDRDSLIELSDSVKNNGVLQPILVRKEGEFYQIVAGERRYQAAKMAGLTEIPVVVRDIPDSEVFKLALIENLQREDLNPMEEAQGYQKLLQDTNMTQEELGQLVSKSRSTIANSLRLLDLPDEIQEMMVEGKITAGHARAILSVNDKEGQIRLANKVVEENLTVRKTESIAPLFSDYGLQTVRSKKSVMPESYKRAASQLRIALGTNVKVRNVRNKNKIEIEFKDEEDLVRLMLILDKTNEGEQ